MVTLPEPLEQAPTVTLITSKGTLTSRNTPRKNRDSRGRRKHLTSVVEKRAPPQ